VVEQPLPAAVAAQQALAGRDAGVVVDVGAGYGETTTVYRRAFPSATIYAFEPTPEAAEALRRRHEGEPVEVVEAAVGAAPAEASLNVNRFQPTSSLLATAATADSYWGEGVLDTEEVVTVPLLTLDRFCADRGIERIDLLKIDVQGAEHLVLAGARDLLARQAVRALYFEVLLVETYDGQVRLDEYLALLYESNYVLAGVHGQVIREGRLLSRDLLARPRPA
jgi:FkbM family methyltransferase